MSHTDQFLRKLVHLYREGKTRRVVGVAHFCRESGANPIVIKAFADELKSDGYVVETLVPATYRLTPTGYRVCSHRFEPKDPWTAQIWPPANDIPPEMVANK